MGFGAPDPMALNMCSCVCFKFWVTEIRGITGAFRPASLSQEDEYGLPNQQGWSLRRNALGCPLASNTKADVCTPKPAQTQTQTQISHRTLHALWNKCKTQKTLPDCLRACLWSLRYQIKNKNCKEKQKQNPKLEANSWFKRNNSRSERGIAW